MRAALWTINDFPAYDMISGWSTHGKLACPYCMENKKAFKITNGGKASFFYCHSRFLPTNHRYKNNIKDLFIGKVDKDVALPRLRSEELHDIILEYDDIIFGFQSGKQKFPGFGLTHNQAKRSIFWELFYWKTNLLRHNLDVIHIENNIFENIFNTIMDVKGKTKENIKVRLDITLFYNCKIQSWFLLGHRSQNPEKASCWRKMHNYQFTNSLRVCVFPMDMPQTYQGLLIWRDVDYME